MAVGFPLDSVIATLRLLSPAHQEVVGTLVNQLARLQGLEASQTSVAPTESLAKYIPAWRNTLDSPRTIRVYEYYIRRLLSAIPTPTTLALDEYFACLRERVSPTARRNEMKAAKSFFSFLLDRQVYPTNPMAKIKLPRVEKKEKVCPSEEEVDKLLGVLDFERNPKATVMLFLFMNTGIRFTEMASIRCSQVNLAQRKVIVLGKGNKERAVFFRPHVAAMLEKALAGRNGHEMLFPTTSKTGIWDNSDANKMIARLCKRAGIRKYTCHQFRHYFTTHSYRAGMKLKALQELLGHASSQITLDTYTHMDEEEIEAEHDKYSPLGQG